MSFVSLVFIIFLLVTIVLYFLFPKKYRYIVLLLANIFFYVYSCRLLSVFLFFSIVSVYFSGKAIEKEKNKKKRKGILWLTIAVNVLVLLLFKDYNLFASSINGHFGSTLSLIDIAAPIGISYYTLVAISYLIDIYYGRTKAIKNLVKLVLPMTFFPLMIEGPIVKVGEIADSLYEGQKFDYKNLKYGYLRILWGLMKKLVIADRAAIMVNQVFGGDYTGLHVIAAMILYAVQIYAEFSGCMDIVIGIGRIFGVKIPENFRQPFFSRDISEFWRRWHITLGRWLKDYIFFPLAMSKKNLKINLVSHKKLPRFLADVLTSFVPLFGVWSIMGLWHGYGIKYFVYGMYYFVLIILGMLLKPLFDWGVRRLKIKTDCFSFHFLQSTRTCLFVIIGLTLFRSESLSAFSEIILNATRLGDFYQQSLIDLMGGMHNLVVLCGAFLAVLIVDFVKYRGIGIDDWLEKQNLPFRYAVFLGILFSVLIFGMYGYGYNPASFIYEGF